ncbi:DUF7289 family protein [Haloarcula amylovorans]|uniref:DUF7289 family protein n=1 Tax=Haloarcula amylovorans TaxID=2562280 RepID=UPI001075ED26|nr:hypothetical protein [Halomicroarcula amylolytica]
MSVGWAETGNRGQSPVIGFVLLLAVVAVTVIAVVSIGGSAITTTQSQLGAEQSARAMTQLDSQAELVILGGSDVQSVNLQRAGRGEYIVEGTAGWMNVSYENTTAGTRTTVFNETMGAFVYEGDGSRVAYQGGGVWRTSDDGRAVMVSPPELHYRNATLTIPLVTVSGGDSIDDRAVIRHDGTTRHYPTATATNPLDDGTVTVTVQSEYYRAWGEYFETRTSGDVTYEHANDRVTLLLTVPADYPAITAGVISGSPRSTVTIENKVVMDSYNSSTGGYRGPSPSGGATKLLVAGDLIIEKSDIYGDVEVGGTVRFTHPNGRLHGGNISYGDGLSPNPPGNNWNAGSNNWRAANASVEGPESVEGLIDERRSALAMDANDNATTANVSAGRVVYSAAGPAERAALSAGAYSLDDLVVGNGQTLVLDTSEGDIDIYVDGEMAIDRGEIAVIGDGRVNVYLQEDLSIEGKHGSREVGTGGENATQFWVYMNPDATAEFGSQVSYTGVIYGPGRGTEQGAELTFTSASSGSRIYGAFVGDAATINNFDVYYDEALSNTETVQRTSRVPAVTYVHASTNDVTIAAG